MKVFGLVNDYVAYIKGRWDESGRLFKVFLFLLAPQIVASIVTGYSLIEIWRNRNSENQEIKKHFARNVTLWVLAMMWFWGFWLIIFPTLMYLLGLLIA